MSHHGGDWQHCLNALVFARQNESDIAIKISQRLIPVMPELWTPMFEAFKDPAVAIVIPGQLDKKQVARPSATFFTKFPVMTDLVAMRVADVDPNILLSVYRERFHNAKTHHDALVEFAWNHMIQNHFLGKAVVLEQWSRHVPFKPKLYLRRSQSIPSEYTRLAAMEDVTGPFELAEWAVIEKKNYACKPKIV